MLQILVKYGIPTDSSARAVEATKGLSDEALESLIFDATDGGSLPTSEKLGTAAAHAVNAIINLDKVGEATPERVAAQIAKRVPFNPPAPKTVTVQVAAAVVEETTATETESETAEAEATASDAALNALATPTTVSTPAKRAGRPKLAETAYDRAVAYIATQKGVARKLLPGMLVEAGIVAKKTSAAVYVCKAAKAGLLDEPAPAAE